MSVLTGSHLYSPRCAYDLAAADYDQWPWQAFWRSTEAPVILSWLTAAPGRRLLDVGSGTGYYLQQLISLGFCATGLDVSSAMLGIAAGRLGGDVPLVLGDARCLPFKSASFDQILITRVLSHVDDVPAVLREATRVLVRGGSLVVSDIDPAHNYSNTELPVAGHKISVETYKRSLGDVVAIAAVNGGFTLSRQSMIRGFDNSGRDVVHGLSSIEADSDRPIAFMAQFIVANQ